MSADCKAGLITLAQKLVERANSDNGNLDNVVLFYPEDLADYDTFVTFAYALDAYLTLKDTGEGGVQMTGFGLNTTVDVE